ncbi:MAG: hypothetical protein FJ405_08645 [Verrucomicrobia bacterium]|nr:hypothetical protein [Verrucomicrobiota bacterium]
MVEVEKLERKMSVRFPEIRKQIGFLAEAVWRADDQEQAKPQDIGLAAHYFLEDWELDGNADVLAGSYLEASEIEAVQRLALLLLELTQKYGWELPSADYASKSEWPEIKQAAKVALEVMGKA